MFHKRIFGTNFAYCKAKEVKNEKRRKKSAQYRKGKTNKLSLNTALKLQNTRPPIQQKYKITINNRKPVRKIQKLL